MKAEENEGRNIQRKKIICAAKFLIDGYIDKSMKQ